MRIRVRAILFLSLVFVPSGVHSRMSRQTVMVPMRDGVRLATDIYLPTIQTGRLPCIFMRTPYGKGSGLESWMTELIELLQYAVAIQDMRGRYDSEGVDSVYFSDGWGRHRDGYDAVEWLAAQPWSNGKIGMIGASASGITQYFAAGAAPPHLSCCVVMVAASNLYEDAIFYGGEFQKALVTGWLEEIGDASLIPFFKSHHDSGPVYDTVNLTARFDSVNVPILHVSGWHDIFIQGVINAYSGIQDSGGPLARGRQKLLIGPWVHNIQSTQCGELTFPGSDVMAFLGDIINWYEFWLKGKSSIQNIPTVRYYLMGDADRTGGPGNRWITDTSWPPASKTVPIYFRSGGGLTLEASGAAEPPEPFDFDPANPVPTAGGRNLSIAAGSYDQRSVESRGDVLVYTTEPLDDSLVVAGRVRVRLWAGSDALDTDFTAKLCDVYPDGRSMLVADGILQARHRNSLEREELLTPGNVNEFTIDLWSTAIAFTPGHRIRVSISSSNDPRFEVNPNTGEPFGAATRTAVALQTVYHDALHPSAVELPVLNGVPRQNSTMDLVLGQNYPNPFGGETRIPVFVSKRDQMGTERILLEIVDILGRRVRHWRLAPENQILLWDGTDGFSRPLPQGVYVGCIRSGSSVSAKKFVLLRQAQGK
jgi:predicted acyl esterase